jgi:acetyl esterase/lipase
MNKLSYIFLIGLFLYSGKSDAQINTINVWNGKIPGSIHNPSYIAVKDSDQYWVRISKVSQPVLDVYPAQNDKANGSAVIICPGGGYQALAIKHEGAEVAAWLNSLGITAFVLKYRLPDDAIMKDKTIGPLQDVQEAIRLVRRRAKEWNIDLAKIGVIGFSAGGHLASSAGTHFNDKVYESIDTVSARPDFSILIYPVISMDTAITHMGSRNNLLGKRPAADLTIKFSNEKQVDENTPPTFLVHSLDDNAVPVQNSIGYALALKKFNVPCELHIYEKGGHGYGLGRTTGTESTWTEACRKWLKVRGYL